MSRFKLESKFKSAGDQPEAIKKLVSGIDAGKRHQVLLGVTGSGKTFTVANVINQIQKPTLVLAHNKTLAAQLAQEYKSFFPQNAVHYFVSYYDYYQPEAYLPATDTYIEKDAKINEEIERLRHASTQALLTRKDVIIVASVSAIYGLGNPERYRVENLFIETGQSVPSRKDFLRKFIDIHFDRTNADLTPGTFRAIGGSVEVMPSGERSIFIFDISDGRVSKIVEVDHITREIKSERKTIFIFPAKHFLTDKKIIGRVAREIRHDLGLRLKELENDGKILEVERLKRRTSYDLALIKEVGYCSGIENYSRYFDGRAPGEPPFTLLSYFPHKKDGSPDFLTIIDESHVTVSQIAGMYAGDRARKKTLIEYGFRLPSALDNRPLNFEEFMAKTGETIYTSATPGSFELEQVSDSKDIIQQIVRPTGLVDPTINVRPVTGTEIYVGQVGDFIAEAEKDVKKGGRVIATTLTKKMAENLSSYLKDKGMKSEYLHSEIKTIERIKILSDFRKGVFDIIVGVNLLREGLDLPEVTLIGILDADKEGFLRSTTSLIQIIGRAARNVDGRVILYADRITGSLKSAMEETSRRREKQLLHNKKHGIIPETIIKAVNDITEGMEQTHDKAVRKLLKIDLEIFGDKLGALIKQKEKQMNAAAKILDFETAAILRDELKELELIMKRSA